jgi:hypothetical protein
MAGGAAAVVDAAGDGMGEGAARTGFGVSAGLGEAAGDGVGPGEGAVCAEAQPKLRANPNRPPTKIPRNVMFSRLDPPTAFNKRLPSRGLLNRHKGFLAAPSIRNHKSLAPRRFWPQSHSAAAPCGPIPICRFTAFSTSDELGSADRFEPTAAHRCRPTDYSIFSLG